MLGVLLLGYFLLGCRSGFLFLIKVAIGRETSEGGFLIVLEQFIVLQGVPEYECSLSYAVVCVLILLKEQVEPRDNGIGCRLRDWGIEPLLLAIGIIV